MSLARIAHSLGVGTIAVVLALTAYGARADGAAPTAHATHHAVHVSAHASAHKVRDAKFVAPVPHKYGANGMRMGLHCETHDPS